MLWHSGKLERLGEFDVGGDSAACHHRDEQEQAGVFEKGVHDLR
jgi:hypothetical protein